MKERSNLPSRSVVWLATAALLLFSYFIAALLLLHVLRPDYTIADHMISDYAIGAFGPIMTSAFLSISLGCLALATGLLRIGPKSWLGRASAGLLIVAFAGLIVTAVFPTDLETAASTRTGDIHNIRGGPGCLNRLAVWISGSPLVDHAAARSGWSKYTWSGVLVPRAECGRMLL